MNGKFVLVDHPILQHKLTVLRNKHTPAAEFRRVMDEMSRLLAYEITRDLKMKEVEIETPMERTTAQKVDEKISIIAIMRSGLGMLDGLLAMLPFANAGHMGIYRDKFIQNTVEYYFRLPNDIKGRRILLADPLLATGDTAVAGIDRLKQYEVGPIRMVCLLASPEGVAKVHQFHPDVDVIAVARERGLNEDGFLLPGIGDAGDRLYQTKAEE